MIVALYALIGLRENDLEHISDRTFAFHIYALGLQILLNHEMMEKDFVLLFLFSVNAFFKNAYAGIQYALIFI